MDAKREQIHLLAIKYGLSPEKAELATWDFYRKHDPAFRLTIDKGDILYDGKPVDILKLNGEMSKGVPDTVRELAIKYGFDERVFAAFIVDLRLYDRMQK